MGVWNQLEYLMGQSLKTLEQSQPFEITDITENDIQIFVYTTKQTRRIKRGVLEGAWMQLHKNGRIRQSDLRNNFSSSNSVYISSILAAMPGISFRLDPLELIAAPQKS